MQAIEVEREDDGRWLAEVMDLPGVLAYGQTRQEALERAQALALRVLAERYGIDEHRHRFSVWAAARAAQRGFTTVKNLRKALESSGVVGFLSKCGGESVDEATFETHHRSWCRAIMSSLTDAGVKNVTFGRAAKLIAVYLKSIVVLGPGYGSPLSRVAHPPIDSILLSNLARSPDVVSPYKDEWARVRFTKLDEAAYYRLIKQLRDIDGPDTPFWKLERYWTVTDEHRI